MDPAEHPAEYPRVVRQWIPLEQVDSGSRRVSRQWIPSIPPEWLLPGAQLGLHLMLVPSCFECMSRLGKGDAFVLGCE